MVSMKLKHARINPTRLARAIERAKPSVTRRQAGLLRKTAAFSIKSRKKPSTPGQPPHSHAGTLRRLLWYDYDPSGDGAAVVGPAKSNQVFFGVDGKPVRGTVPNVLEFGGEIRILEVQTSGPPGTSAPWHWRRADLRSKRRLAGKPKRLRKVKIAARPYMEPALDKSKRLLPGFWAGAVRDG